MAMTRKQKRLAVIGGALAFLAVATTLTLFALGQKASYFYTPADVAEKGVAAGESIRLGGLVATGSIARGEGTDTPNRRHDSPPSVSGLPARGVRAQ